MSEIIIGGVSINALKKQRDAMKQEASAFVAKAVSEATELIQQIVDSEDPNSETELAEKAKTLLDNARLVGQVCDVHWYLPYNEPYSGSNALSDSIEYALDEKNETWAYGSNLADLYDTLQAMEHDTFLWNSSSIGC
jgi:HPt (histidine-containing phosphotransfer) domain-containing protein